MVKPKIGDAGAANRPLQQSFNRDDFKGSPCSFLERDDPYFYNHQSNPSESVAASILSIITARYGVAASTGTQHCTTEKYGNRRRVSISYRGTRPANNGCTIVVDASKQKARKK